MKRHSERAGDVEPSRRLRTRVVSEAVVAALPEERPRTRVISEAVVAAIPEGGGAAEGSTDAEAEAGA